ncbi:large subunit of N,N-dimethylformamidase [Sphaerisporangium krabiense]|uniref:N,N-dimethylformamidase n=1 Tax=Sphaerisporangium krabiense TaxID=763782 RepID=A0A7W8Z525_9ACTN|nr:N,N-dimethylformamidase beta subunit family domain-containing protein [Sphaerisporangium krabiense]MBB5627603.1 N,N-dimethylformamidase [Sphaerisporangium krabiense]GII66617.1 large subunit of N,N-dimethylformamidase [Sphaerisporangium krabiense]
MESSTAKIQARFDERRAGLLRSLITEDLIKDWTRDPHAGDREPLSWVLRFLGRRPPAERVTVYESVPGREWRLARQPARRGDRYRLADRRRFTDLAEAREACLRRELHEVFGWGEPPADAADGPELTVDGPVLLGYADRISAAPGDPIAFMVSAEGVEEYTTELVRLRHVDDNPAGPGVRVETVPDVWQGRHRGRTQTTRLGSHIAVPDPGGVTAGGDGFAVVACVYPTFVTGGRQTIVARWSDGDGPRGYALGLDEAGRLTLWLGDGVRETATRIETPLGLHLWHGVGASHDPATGAVVLVACPLVNSVNSRLSPAVVDDRPQVAEGRAEAAFTPATGGELLFAALTPDAGHYNGKIESPALWSRPLDRDALAAAVSGEPDAPLRWWFGPQDGDRAAASLTVPCAGRPELDGRLVNMPVRGVTGRHYTGETDHYAHDPRGYGAIHFHDDELADSGWEPGHELTVPDGLPSGVYALRVTAADGSCERAIPFVVRPPRGAATGDIALMLPTCTYLAYANERGLGYVPVVPPGVAFLEQRYDLGHSMYARHTDGSGVCHSSARRPILTLAPGFSIHLSPFMLATDLYIVDWLTEMGYSFDVITDHDLHAEGAELLGRYRGVISGSHPEYASGRMLDAIETYVDGGGNFAYIGGNGYYWVVSFHPELPHVMELRRGLTGTRSWQVRPGEEHHATTGERGGLWAGRNRPPQKLFGVGFSAQGGDPSGRYRVGPDHDGDLAAKLLDGVPEVFADIGLIDGGAVGNEIDRYDLALGSPPDAIVLATSEGLGDSYQFVVEELEGTNPGQGATENPRVRSDMVYFRTRGGGSVFSTGSISYSSGLSANGYDNGLSRVTRNVIDHWLAADV